MMPSRDWWMGAISIAAIYALDPPRTALEPTMYLYVLVAVALIQGGFSLWLRKR